MHRATQQMDRANGKVMRNSVVVRAAASGLSAKPGAMSEVMGPAASSASTVSAPRITTSQASAARAVAWAAGSPCSCRVRVYTGTKAMVMEPSPNRLRSRFGMRNATKNASAAQPAPSA